MMATQGKRVELELYCALTEEELRSRALMLVEAVTAIDDTEAARTAATKEFRERITGLVETQRKLSKILRDQAERRMVQCAVLFHVPQEGTKRVVRLDTGEIAREEAMSAADLQLNIWNSPNDFIDFMRGQGVEETAADLAKAEPEAEPAQEALPLESDDGIDPSSPSTWKDPEENE